MRLGDGRFKSAVETKTIFHWLFIYDFLEGNPENKCPTDWVKIQGVCILPVMTRELFQDAALHCMLLANMADKSGLVSLNYEQVVKYVIGECQRWS